MTRHLRLAAMLIALLVAACGRSNEGAVQIAFIGAKDDPFEPGVRLSAAAQHVHAATEEGLVGLDAQGQVIPALADRWIVTDDGTSYIFRLRDGKWRDGSDLSGDSARIALRRAIRRLAGTSLGLDLSEVEDVRAMAGRVVEIRLKGPMPEFLQLLAQPELGLTHDGSGAGPMQLKKQKDTAILTMIAPEDRGLPQVEGWQKYVRELHISGLPAAQAIKLFDDGQVDLVLNGRIQALPLVDTGPLSRGTVRLDPALGLFGLIVRHARGFLADPANREAIAMAIDRDGLIEPFNVGGWSPTTRLVAAGLEGDSGEIGERWQDMNLAQRRRIAAQRVASWPGAKSGKPPELTIDLPAGPGGDILFTHLAGDFKAIGLVLRRAKQGEVADLDMVDRVARYSGARWFLDQFNCTLRLGVCSSAADKLVAQAVATEDPEQSAALLVQAEQELTRANGFIPFGPPVRFSLVRAGIDGFAANRWVFHPLPQLAAIPR